MYDCHRLMLTSSTMWIDDEIVWATQNLLKKQFSGVGGLQPPALAQQCAMEPQTGKFIQVLNTGQSHWLTISNMKCPQSVIQVYDSMHQPLNPATKRIIADLMMCKDKAISMHFAPVQWQSGCTSRSQLPDCGLFVLAICHSICVGHNPTAVSAVF